MKRIKSKLAIVLMMMLIFTSFEFVGVFAEGEGSDAPAVAPATAPEEEVSQPEETSVPEDVEIEEPEQQEPEAQEEEADANTEAVQEEDSAAITNQEDVTYNITYTATAGGSVSSPSDEVVDVADINGSTATPETGYSFVGWYSGTKKVSDEETLTAEVILSELGENTTGSFEAKFEKFDIIGLKSLSSYRRVYLRWKNPAPAEDVTYTITCNGKTILDNASVKKRPDGWYEYVAMNLSSDINCLTGKYPAYTFTVTATNKSDGYVTETKKITDAPVRTIAYKIKIKSSSTLKSHYGPNGKQNGSKTFKVKKGQYIYAYGYGFGGKYVFKDPRGYVFFCNLTRTKSRSCVYLKSQNYTDEKQPCL